MAVHVLAFPEESDEKELGCGMRVQAPGDQEVRNRYPVGDFGIEDRQRAKAGRSYTVTNVDISNNGKDNIEDCRESL